MKITVIEQKENYLKMIVEDIDPPFANSLRRVMIAEVPSLAIEDVWIVDNNSSLYDEIIAHRLGLIPLRTDLKTFVVPSKCACSGEGCAQCQVAFTLNKEATEGPLTIYAEDLQSEDTNITPCNPKIPIVELVKGQRLVLEAYAKLGIGEAHAKWQPVATCVYKFLPNITINYETCEKCKKCVDACPKHIISFKENVQISDVMACHFCKSCEEVCEVEPKAIQVNWDASKFIFTIESTGALSCEEIVKTACQVLKDKIKAFLDTLETL